MDRGRPYHFFRDNCFEIRPLVFGLGPLKFRGEMTDALFFSYKFLIYGLNLTKILNGAIAAHKPCEFQEYRLRKTPLRLFGGYQLEIPRYGPIGVIFGNLVCYALPSLTPVGAMVRLRKSSLRFFGFFFRPEMSKYG